jgi:hypothetical protein
MTVGEAGVGQFRPTRGRGGTVMALTQGEVAVMSDGGARNLKRCSISGLPVGALYIGSSLLLVLASWAGSVGLIRSSNVCGPVPGLKGWPIIILYPILTLS